jgi:preprotein translocase subunit SecE
MKNPAEWLFNYIKEVQLEGKKVNWPTRERTIRDTIIVIIFSSAVAAILASFDFVFSHILKNYIIPL